MSRKRHAPEETGRTACLANETAKTRQIRDAPPGTKPESGGRSPICRTASRPLPAEGGVIPANPRSE